LKGTLPQLGVTDSKLKCVSRPHSVDAHKGNTLNTLVQEMMVELVDIDPAFKQLRVCLVLCLNPKACMSFIHVIFPEILKCNLICLGNPGTGKSTWLNNIAGPRKDGSVRFSVGVKYGSGLTTALQIEEAHGVRYADTPVLADIAIREKVFEEIKEGLVQNGAYSAVFFIRLESGRPIGNGVATMATILKLSPPLRCCHSIMFNKLTTREHNDLHKMARDDWESLKAQIVMVDGEGNILPFTKHVFFQKRIG